MNRRHLTITALVACLAGALACQDEPCDSTTTYISAEGVCRARPAVDGGVADGTAATDAAVADASAIDGTKGSGFGMPCKISADCTGEANACFIRMGEPMGFCSAAGCDSKPDLCPKGWICFDLSVIQPGAPFGCVKAP